MTDQRLRWAVAIVDLDPVEGHEQGGSRRVLVVSNEPFHRGGLMTICPITSAWTVPRYDNEVPIPKGHAGQTRDGVILCHQVRTVSIERIQTVEVGGGGIHYVTDASIRTQVRDALGAHLGLNIPPAIDTRA
jgi:mRNA interferase MazF